MELAQAQPTLFGPGFTTLRAWVNGVDISQVNFGDFTSGKVILPNMSSITLDLCSQKNYETMDSVNGFNGDILNLLWFRGVAGLYSNTTSKFSSSIN